MTRLKVINAVNLVVVARTLVTLRVGWYVLPAFFCWRAYDTIISMNIALLTIVAILVVAMLIPQLLVRSAIGPLFRVFVIPGVIVHELAHALFCVLTGAKIRRIRVFRRDGGDVAHEQSKIPIVGQLLITLAPLLIGIMLIILMATRIAPYITDISVGTSVHDFPQFLITVLRLVQWGHATTWLWLYLMLSIGATAAPSWRDLRNSWIPIVLIILALAYSVKTGLFRGQLDHALIMLVPALTVALFILLIIAALALVVYLLSLIFGITR